MLKDDQEATKELSNLLSQCFDIFPLYGREPEAAANIRKAFRFILADYNIGQITTAFRYHLRVYKDFPVPADIVNIIERGNKPPFERSVYIRICKKHKDFPETLTHDEWDYMKDYERFVISGKY